MQRDSIRGVCTYWLPSNDDGMDPEGGGGGGNLSAIFDRVPSGGLIVIWRFRRLAVQDDLLGRARWQVHGRTVQGPP